MQREGNVLLLIAASGITALWCADRVETPAQTAAPPALTVTAEVATGPVVADAAPAIGQTAAAAPDASKQLELPDGSFVPALNGAVNAAPLARFWSPHVPWSPIVATERSDAGVDWYRHADGSYSTTQMVWRQDLGRHEAMTRVAHPGPAAPTAAK
jgi:hypothetical protein